MEIFKQILALLSGMSGGVIAFNILKSRSLKKTEKLTDSLIRGYTTRFNVHSVTLVCERCDEVFFSKCFDDLVYAIDNHESKCPVLKVVK